MSDLNQVWSTRVDPTNLWHTKLFYRAFQSLGLDACGSTVPGML